MYRTPELELKRRLALTAAFDAVIDRLFLIPSTHGKMRRDAVHRAVGDAMGVSIINNIPARKLVIELLKSKGVRLGSTDGKRYFRGIEERQCMMTK